MNKVGFSGLLTSYNLSGYTLPNPYGEVKMEMVVSKSDMPALASFLNGCLDDGWTSTDKFTITLEVNDGQAAL